MQRDYAQFELRSVDEEQRIIEGIANTASVDSHGTIIEPAGAVFKLPIPFSIHHHRTENVGEVIATELRNGQRWVTIQIARVVDDGTEGARDVKRRVDAAWAEFKSGLIRGLSIEFDPIEPRDTRVKRWTRWRWLRLSGVSMPSNADASIFAIRAVDEAASPGVTGTPNNSSPGVTGTHANQRRVPMTIQEQIQQHENSRAAKVARQTALMDAAGAAGETLGPTEAEEYDTLTREVEAIDGHLSRLNGLQRSAAATATRAAGNTSAAATASRGGEEPSTQTRGGVPVVRVNHNEEPGLGFARYVMSLAACQGNRYEAAEYARSMWGDQGEGVAVMHRAAVAAGTTTNATFAAPLVQTNYLSEFLELLRPRTLIGRIQGLRRVPFNVQMTAQTAGGTYTWVGQGVPKPVTNLQVAAVTLGIAKAAGIIVISDELARSSTPSAQEVTRNEMRDGMQQYLDTQFVDPAVAAVANVSPASITNGVAGTAASGATEADARADLRALVAAYATANYGLDGLVLLMGESLAFTLGTMVNAVGAPAFPGLGVNGGSILGIPVITSNVTPLQTRIVALHAPSVMFADDGQTVIDISREATVIMDSTPATVVQAAGAAPIHTSLWQNNLVGIRAERWINWGKARSTAVDMIHTVAYA